MGGNRQTNLAGLPSHRLMKIVIDARWILDEISGVGTYTVELIRALSHLDRDNDYILLFDKSHLMDRTTKDTHFNPVPNMVPKQVKYGPFSLTNQCKLPAFLREHDVDVYHSPNYMIPFRCFPKNGLGRTKCVTTIHDVIPLLFPDHAPKSKKARLFPIYKRVMQEVGARSNAILAVSECSRRDIIAQLKIPAARQPNVVTIYNGVNPLYKPSDANRQDGPPIILYVGRFDPYKNVSHLIEAFHELRKQGVNAKLRIIGPLDARYTEPVELVKTLKLQPYVEWSGYVADTDLLRAYHTADVFVLPSKYEGFGLPVVEAMASGTPVICSNAGSLPEVAGKAAILVDPLNRSELTDAFKKVLTTPDLSEDFSRKGLVQAKEFRWEKTAEETLAIYEQVGGGG